MAGVNYPTVAEEIISIIKVRLESADPVTNAEYIQRYKNALIEYTSALKSDNKLSGLSPETAGVIVDVLTVVQHLAVS